MKSKINSKLLVIASFMVAMLFCQCSTKTLLVDKEESVRSYLKERVLNSNKENVLVPFDGSAELKLSDVDGAKEKIWTLWKEVNNEIEKLPALSSIDGVDSELHQWDLIDEDPLPFYFFKKEGNQGSQKKPLILNLHGSGPKAQEFNAALSLSKRYEDSPSVYFVPQIPSMQRYRWWYQPVQNAWEKLFRLAMINEEIDPNKIFIIGISEGGYGSQRLGAYYADYLAGVGPMAGGEPLKNAPPLNYRNVAFSFHTGEHDGMFGRNELTTLAKTTFESLATENPGDFAHNIVIQKDRGHAIDYTLTTPWLMRYTRRVSPNHISWVHFPMHERYRKGFYNVAIDDFPQIKEQDEFNRMFFDIKYNKQENTITVDASLMSDDMSQTKELSEGKISLFLDDSYVDYSKNVKVIYNGNTVHDAKLTLREENLIESCGLFGDPNRLYPAKVSITL